MADATVIRQASLSGINKTTTDHQEIRGWIEKHHGHPILIKRPGREDEHDELAIDFSETRDRDTIMPLAWDDFFRIFEARKLAFVYQVEALHGEEGLFNSFMERDRIKSGSRDRGQIRVSRKTRGAEKSKNPDRKQ